MIAGSSNGRTQRSGRWYPGSNPGPAAKILLWVRFEPERSLVQEVLSLLLPLRIWGFGGYGQGNFCLKAEFFVPNLFKVNIFGFLVMKIKVIGKPGAKKERIERVDEDTFKVWVKERPEKNKANKAILKALASYFKVSLSQVKIVSGQKSFRKIVKIEDY